MHFCLDSNHSLWCVIIYSSKIQTLKHPTPKCNSVYMIKFSHANNGKLTPTFVLLETRILCREALLLQTSKVQHPCTQYKYLYQVLAHLVLRVWGFSGSLPCKLLTSSVRMLLVKSSISLVILCLKMEISSYLGVLV